MYFKQHTYTLSVRLSHDTKKSNSKNVNIVIFELDNSQTFSVRELPNFCSLMAMDNQHYMYNSWRSAFYVSAVRTIKMCKSYFINHLPLYSLSYLCCRDYPTLSVKIPAKCFRTIKGRDNKSSLFCSKMQQQKQAFTTTKREMSSAGQPSS